MKYILKSGLLMNEKEEKILAQIKPILIGWNKEIFSTDGTMLLNTTVETDVSLARINGDVRSRKYIMYDNAGKELAFAHPYYDDRNNPDIKGWPACYIPKVNLAKIQYMDMEYILTRHDNTYYTFITKENKIAITIKHRGINGGWTIEANDKLTPQIICGFFIFCKYLERENEFILI